MYELASASGVKIGEFMRTLMRYAQEKQVKVRPNSDDKARWYAAIKEGNNPLPSVRLEVIIEEKEEEFHEKSMDQLSPALTNRLLKPSLAKQRS